MENHLSFHHCLADAYRAAIKDGYTAASSMRTTYAYNHDFTKPLSELAAEAEAIQAVRGPATRMYSWLYNKDTGLLLGPDDAIHLSRQKVIP